jgi:hypothetical protein
VAEAARVLAELLPEGTEALLAPLRSRGPLGEAGDGPRSAVADLTAGEGTPLLLAPLGVALDGFDTLYSLDISLRRYAERRGVREVLLCPPYNSDPAFVSGLADLSEESG